MSVDQIDSKFVKFCLVKMIICRNKRNLHLPDGTACSHSAAEASGGPGEGRACRCRRARAARTGTASTAAEKSPDPGTDEEENHLQQH